MIQENVDLRLLRTEPLDEQNFNRAMAEIPNLLTQWQQHSVLVMYGFAVNLPVDDLWKPMLIQTSELLAFLERSTHEGIFRPRESDIHIEDVAKTFDFRLCHESDVHFEADDSHRIPDVLTVWGRLNLGVYGSRDSRGGVAAPKKWVKLS